MSVNTQEYARLQARHEAVKLGEFNDVIPLVEDILDNYSDMLSDQEEAWMCHYLQFIKYQNVSCPNTIADEAEKIICNIHDL